MSGAHVLPRIGWAVVRPVRGARALQSDGSDRGRGRPNANPPIDTTHRSSRKLAAELGSISHMTVTRVWAKHALRPHRLEGYRASNDPDFEVKAPM